jgi:hypothetical protein
LYYFNYFQDSRKYPKAGQHGRENPATLKRTSKALPIMAPLILTLVRAALFLGIMPKGGGKGVKYCGVKSKIGQSHF